MDGSAAAYAAWLKFGDNAKYIPVQYKRPAPEIEFGANVYILDFSYSKDILLGINSRAQSLVVLDHHKTAMADLKDLPFAQFDMNRSGAGISWDYFHPGTPRPKMIDLIEDRDLWRFNLAGSKELNAGLGGMRDFRELASLNDGASLNSKIELGKLLLGPINKQIDLAPTKAFGSVWDDKVVAVTNTTTLISEIGEKLYTDYAIDMAVMYFITQDGKIVFSLRSKNIDVAEFARTKDPFGGGHSEAAGFSLPLEFGFIELNKLFNNRFDLSEVKCQKRQES
jgi:oligoribonuclease NrnB/cAMP/cGMP phosphodiesterase (DHH superfamily)